MTQLPAPQAPTAPTPPAPGAGIVVTPRALNAAPLTAQDVAALLARRRTLSDQVSSASSRRRDVARQLRTATGADKAGLEQRLVVLDSRIARLESDIDETGDSSRVSPGDRTATTAWRTTPRR
jgi:hypothetical protein